MTLFMEWTSQEDAAATGSDGSSPWKVGEASVRIMCRSACLQTSMPRSLIRRILRALSGGGNLIGIVRPAG